MSKKTPGALVAVTLAALAASAVPETRPFTSTEQPRKGKNKGRYNNRKGRGRPPGKENPP
jgi:hypothetical protein